MSIQTVIAWTQTQLKATSAAKISFAPDYATDTVMVVPTAITIADNIRFQAMSSGLLITLFDLHVDILIPRGLLEDAMQWLAGVPKAVADIFRNDPTFGATAKTYDGDITATLAAGQRGGIDMIGYTIVVPNVKLHE
jgi:hypothetical protein